MQIEINNKIIVAILVIIMLYLLYHFTTSFTVVKINKHIESFTNQSDNVNSIITNIPIPQKAPEELNYNDRADVVITDADLNIILDNLIPDSKNVNPMNTNKGLKDLDPNKGLKDLDPNLMDKDKDVDVEVDQIPFELITRTNQDKMFIDLEKKLIDQYDKTTSKDGFYKSIERPLQGSSLISTNEVKNSSLNPVMNPHMFNESNLQNEETIWQAYDKLTSTGHVNNYDDLKPNDISSQYILGNNGQYGSTFDNYSKN
jgi:hypothetical protein